MPREDKTVFDLKQRLFLSQREPKTFHKQNLASSGSDPRDQILEIRLFLALSYTAFICFVFDQVRFYSLFLSICEREICDP